TSVTQTHVSNDLSKPVTAQTLPSNKKSILKNTNMLAPRMYKIYTDHNQTRTSQLPQDSRKTNKRVLFSTGVIPTTSVSRPQLKSNPHGDRVMRNSSQGMKQEVEDHRRSVKLSKNKMSVTACNDSLNDKTLNVKSVSAMCDKCVLIDKHDMCVLKSVAKPLKEIVASESNKKPRNFTMKLYERVKGIQHQTSVVRTPEQNGVVERRNRTLVEAARTMLSAAKVPLFFWAEAIATACFTQNHSLKMASVQISSDPAPECQTMALEHNSLSPGRKFQENVSHGDKTDTTSNELDLLFSPMFDELLNGSSKVVSKSS
nr:putative ribonuclease H-like domain-containing protein [Tanacetum cinerariifolium]